MAPMYSPITPIDTSKIELTKNIPITTGAIPTEKLRQNKILYTRYARPSRNEINAPPNPVNVISRSGTLEWLMMPSMP